MLRRIALCKGEWFYDESKPLGKPGGFGAVYEGLSHLYGDLAVKRLHLTANDAAHREMRIAGDLSGRTLSYVIPVLDSGEDADSGMYFVVMPKAEKSLQSDIDEDTFTDIEAARVMLEVTNGLSELSDIVHRDLKPANILFHAGRWKIADLGIARFLEESTSLRTLKGCLSPLYAAPEQWQYIRATPATDAYALGCIGYALLTGRPPFSALTPEDLREMHLHADPPPLPNVSPQLRTLLSMMLRKLSNARPTLERVGNVLRRVIQAHPSATDEGGLTPLSEAGADVAREEARRERTIQDQLHRQEERDKLAGAARQTLAEITDRLIARLQSEAPNSQRDGPTERETRVEFRVILGVAGLRVSIHRDGHWDPDVPWGRYIESALPAYHFKHSQWDVIARAEILVGSYNDICSHPNYRQSYIWSASLWYGRLPGTDGYRWYEASYFSSHRAETVVPYSLVDRFEDADLAAAPIMHVYQLAYGPSPIDHEDEDEFMERWAVLLALASQGKLGPPRGLPLQPRFWRQNFVA